MSGSHKTHFSSFVAAGAVFACSGAEPPEYLAPMLGSHAAELRDMTSAEAESDLEQIFTQVRDLYGPYEYKQARFGYSVAELEDEARARLATSPGDDGFYSTARWFFARLADAHVQIAPALTSNPVLQYEIGIVLVPVQGKALVADLFDPSLAASGIGYGDEVVSVDGVSPFELLEAALELESFGNEVSNRHLILRTFVRPGATAALRPTSPTAHVVFRRADGSEYSRDFVWTEVTEPQANLVSPSSGVVSADAFLARRLADLGTAGGGSLASLGSTRPFFVNGVTESVFNVTEVTPNATLLARYGLSPSEVPDIYAALYSYAEKTILLVRQATYHVADEDARLRYYRAILDQYDDFVDGLVIDQTHNPGGSLSYCVNFARLFARQPGQSFVQAFNADRRWISVFANAARSIDPTLSSEPSRNFALRASIVEAAYDAGASLSQPIPLAGEAQLLPDPAYVWQKPVLVLIDELAASCGDVFPMLIQENDLAKLFGQRTMGAGGSVEGFGPLTNSNATFTLTRGLFTVNRPGGAYTADDFVENRGVSPDIEHEISVDDFRRGFVGYMAHFSDVLASEIEASDAAVAEVEAAN